MTALGIPETGSYVLGDARLHFSLTPGLEGPFDHDGFARVDVTVADGRIARIVHRGAAPASPGVIGLAGRIVLPCFVDCHTHIDKGHIWPRMPNPDGTFDAALLAVGSDRAARWNARDVERRMDFSLRAAYAHGTKALRTHIDSVASQETISWPAFEEMRERWRGRMDIQASSLGGIEIARDEAWFNALARRVAAAKGVLGAAAHMLPDLEPLLDRVFRIAADLGLDLDFHADETGDPNAVSLRKIAEAALHHRFQGKVLVGHCCSLSRQPNDEAKRTLDKVAEAGIGIVSLSMCNLYLQDRRLDGTTPRWRGVTLPHEMKARGIPVAIASDNTRDPFYAYGDLDMLEVYRMATRILHLDHPVADWPRAVTATPAALMGVDGGTLAAGGEADLVIFKGRSWNELLARPEADRIVVRAGKVADSRLPDYSELDDLMG